MSALGEHNINLYNRKELLLSGIADVCEFTENTVEMTLDEGYLGIDGECLRIDKFDSETGNIRILGNISALTYYNKGLSQKKAKKKKI